MKLLFMIMASLILVNCSKEASFSAVPNEDLDSSSDPNGPVVRITQAPKNKFMNEDNEVAYEVVKTVNEIKDTRCSIDQFPLPCGLMLGLLKIIPVPLGQHTFEVIAEDTEGLTGRARARWTVSNRFSLQSDLHQITQAQNTVDILFVIDNSSSMRDEQKKISQRFDRFVQQLSQLDWQIAITTTDSHNNDPWADGRLHAFPNQQLFLKSSMNTQEAQELFAKHVQRKEPGWDTETGILSVYRSLERSINPKTQENKDIAKFYRSEAALAVVVVSDEDESGSTFKSKGDELLKLVNQKWNDQKKFQFNSIIAHTRECLSSGGHTLGIKYEALSKKTNGVVGDICANNYSEILKNIGKGVANLQKTFTLKCEPQDADLDGKVEFSVAAKSTRPTPAYTVKGNTVEFVQPLNPDDYEFQYFCLDNP